MTLKYLIPKGEDKKQLNIAKKNAHRGFLIYLHNTNTLEWTHMFMCNGFVFLSICQSLCLYVSMILLLYDRTVVSSDPILHILV